MAVEEREKDEKFDSSKGPSIAELVAKEGVDKLSYMGWTIDQGSNPEKVSDNNRRLWAVYTPTL